MVISSLPGYACIRARVSLELFQVRACADGLALGPAVPLGASSHNLNLHEHLRAPRVAWVIASAAHLKLHLPSPLGAPLHAAAVLVELLPLRQAVEEREVLARTGPQLSLQQQEDQGTKRVELFGQKG